VSHGTLAQAGRLSRAVRAALARWSCRIPKRVVCISDWLRERIGRPDATVVTQGLDLAVFRPAPARGPRARPVVGTIGSGAEAKGYADVCRALALLGDRLGADVLVAATETVALPAGARRLTPLDEPAMADFYHRCDVFVFASRSEGFGLPPLEAMACGCAVITTDCGGVRDFARDAVNCLVVPPADPAALAAAIARAAGDAALREDLGRAGAKTAQAFARETMLARFVEVVAA
jgi:glycosyltransferase involved in cell wall biosynthesis